MSKSTPHGRDAFRYFDTLATRWGDNDQYGHVNNVVYYAYFDTVVNRYLTQQGVLAPESGIIGLVVATGCEYFSSVAFPDILDVGLRVSSMGRSSVRYEVGVFRQDAPHACAQGHFVHVYVDSQSRRPVDLPSRLRAALQAL